MKSQTVSVIVPVHKRANTVGRAMRSVLAQTFGDFELIVVDDGSTEDLAGALREFGDPRIRLTRHANRRGPAAARNAGLKLARGEVIAFLDSDDEWLPGKLQAQMTLLTSASALVCCTVFYLEQAPGAKVSTRKPRSASIFQRDLAFGCGLSRGTTLVARRKCFDEVGGFDANLVRLEDWDWLLRCTRRWPVTAIRTPLARVHSGSWRPFRGVEAASERLKTKHLGEMEAEGFLCGRRFRAALSRELAAASYRERRYRQATGFLVRSFLEYPLRRPSFFFRVVKAGVPSLFGARGVDRSIASSRSVFVKHPPQALLEGRGRDAEDPA